ncbi:SDR family oxidoreductase [Chitinimonas lacunae]|uniref:SDR family oxidoreductase n=1 Tax=Chitinimonas lacunae TaxID=1963018 RepID=A0ABV8MQ68_9NEIS
MSVMLKPIDEQVIVITGASSGIGLATAREAAQRGARLVLAARSEPALSDLVNEIEAQGGQAIYVVADVGVREQVVSIAIAAIARFGRIDTWINNAGVSIYGRLEEVEEQDSRRLFETNFWGVVHGSLVALPYLRRQGGALINIGSEASEAAIPLQGMYVASKHAVKGFTDVLRVEVEQVDKAPVSITLIEPTAVDTPFPQHARNYMAHEPKLPSPQIEPKLVAEAILAAAVTPTRVDKVGVMATLNTAMAKFVPALGDRMAASRLKQQQYPERPRNPEGALYRACGGSGTHGRRPAGSH